MSKHSLVVCIANQGFEASLELRKLYEALPDAEAAGLGQLRVIDESGEDYLYPASLFVSVTLPEPVVERVLHAA